MSNTPGQAPKCVSVDFSVDSIRFIAIFLVIVLHSTGFPYRFLNPEITPMDVVNWTTTSVYAAIGMLGVPLFVMLSGALLLNPDKAEEPLRVFYRKRFNRIALPFIFWTIIYFIWSFTFLGKPITLFNVGQGLLTGSYYHLWYIYLLIGLYAVTPIFRVLVKHLERKRFTLLLILWFIGTVATPLIHTFTAFEFNPVLFVFFDWIGYYLLGIYLVKAHLRRSTSIVIAALGFLGAVFGDWILTAFAGEALTGYFHNYMSATIIIASAATYYCLTTIKTKPLANRPILNNFVQWISKNTLPIYLIHMLLIVTFTEGFFNFYINTITYLPLIDVPLFATIVFGASAIITYLLKKIPYIEKLVG
jgi:surface polysaccharide O-acyltransferase-like enzyme